MKVLLNSVVSKLSKYSGMNKLELKDRMSQIDKLLEDPAIHYYSLNQVGSHMAEHRPVGVLTFSSLDVEGMLAKIEKINNEISICDIKGDDMIIRYTDFDYLRNIYHNGLTEK